MTFEDSVDILNQLLVIHYRSLPAYLSGASPWVHRGDHRAAETVQDIIEDQQSIARRLADAITRRGGIVDMGEFPIEYTDLHFLSLDYLLRELVKSQRADVSAIEQCADRLWNDPPAQALAKECLGAARGHLQSLEELAAEISQAS